MAMPDKILDVAAKDVDALLARFVRDFPLLQKLRYRTDKGGQVNLLNLPSTLSMACSAERCRNLEATTWERVQPIQATVGVIWTYQCLHCGRASGRLYWMCYEASDEPGNKVVVMYCKLGQFPPWDMSVGREIERALPEDDLNLYRKGLANLSQGYGIGALGYLRRVVENRVNGLIDMIEEAAKLEGDQKALAGIVGARQQREATERLRLAADLLPASLRPGNTNPFAVMYGLLSAGLHELSEEECLEIALELKGSLEYVFAKVRRNLDDAKAYGESIARAQRLSERFRKEDGK